MASVVQMKAEHLETVLELVWGMDDSFYHRDMAGAENTMRSILRGDRTDRDFLVALDGDRPVGVAGFRCRPDTDRTYYLSFFAVAGDFRGQGVGYRLLSAVEEELRTRGARLLVAESSPEPYAAPAREFYRRQGFTLDATVDDFWQDGDALALFVKRLAPGPSI